MIKRISAIPNEVQDHNCVAWTMLCDYIDELYQSGGDEFAPRNYLGTELFAQIFTLPESISKLKKVKKINLYGSRLKRIPPEIGQLEALEYFVPYTSYDLHWFPYELTRCKQLIDSTISTRALYGNYKHRMPFPDLDGNPVRYAGNDLFCSVCEREINYESVNQLWISLPIGTDVVPLLANVCSEDCAKTIPTPPEGYVDRPHKGGSKLAQPPTEEEAWELEEREESLVNAKTRI